MWFAFHTNDRSTPREAFNKKLFLVIVVATCGSIIFGYDLAFIGGVFSLPSFITRFDLANQNASALQAHMVNACRSVELGFTSKMTNAIFSPGRSILRCHGCVFRKRKIRSPIRTPLGVNNFQHWSYNIDGLSG